MIIWQVTIFIAFSGHISGIVVIFCIFDDVLKFCWSKSLHNIIVCWVTIYMSCTVVPHINTAGSIRNRFCVIGRPTCTTAQGWWELSTTWGSVVVLCRQGKAGYCCTLVVCHTCRQVGARLRLIVIVVGEVCWQTGGWFTGRDVGDEACCVLSWVVGCRNARGTVTQVLGYYCSEINQIYIDRVYSIMI